MELIATIVITASSVLLFAYWFRYTCLLILSARTTRDYAGATAAANQLSFPEVQSLLRDRASSDLEHLAHSLDRDFKVLTYLLKHAANPALGADAVEKRMLEVDYRMMRAWYGVTRRFSSTTACRALNEMASVIEHFANSMGERAAAAA